MNFNLKALLPLLGLLLCIGATSANAQTATLASMNCGDAAFSKYCWTTVTASGGSLRLYGWTVSGAAQMTVDNVSPANGATPGCNVLSQTTLNAGQSCAVRVTFNPNGATGPFSKTITPRFYTPITENPPVPESGTAGTVSGTGVLPGTAVVTIPSCPGTEVGGSSLCGLATITATGGPVGPNTFTQSGNTTDFTVVTFGLGPTWCGLISHLDTGQSCAFANVTFNPTVAGSRTLTLTTSLFSGRGTNSSGSVTGMQPYTYAWQTGTFGSCTGGSGTWNYSAWSPSTGCGSTAQTRTASCVANSNTGSSSRTVTCQRSDGTTVIDGFCTDSKPSETQMCTPTSGFSCGTQGATSQNVSLTNGCTGTASVNSLACGSAGVGTTKVCSGTISITATGGPIQFSTPAYTVTGATTQFTLTTAATPCAAGAVLASGSSCQTSIVSQYRPTNVGTHTVTVATTPANGGAGSGTVSGSATYGTATLSVSGVVCTITAGTSGNCSGTATITATGGAVTLNAVPVVDSGPHRTDFAVAAGACASASLASGTSCNLGAITFTPGAAGARSVTLTPDSNGTDVGATLIGTGSAPGTATVSGIDCGSTGIGTTKTCSGTVTVTATGGEIRLHSTVYSASGSTQFTLTAASSGACVANQVLVSGASCNLLTATHQPSTAGAASRTITVDPAIGVTGTNTVSGTGVYGTASVNTSGVSCAGNVGVTANCSGNATVTASGGRIILSVAPVFSLTGTNASDFEVGASVSGACTSGQTLNSGASCNLGPISVTAGAGGARTATLQVTPASGSAGSASLSATASYGTATLSVNGVSCTITAGTSGNCSGTATITATGGAVTLTAAPVVDSGPHRTDFAVAAGACASASLASGASCNLGAITFTPGAAGSRSVTLTPASNGTNVGATLVGTASAPGTATVSALACGNTGVGLTKACSGTATVTATGGEIRLGSSVYSAGASTQFTLTAASSGACVANQMLASGASCNLLTATHRPSTAGAASLTITVDPAIGVTGTNTVSGTGIYGTATLSVSGVTCSTTLGFMGNCSGTATITASNGSLTLTATPVDESGSHPGDFAVASGTCASAALASGASCNLGAITFTPGAAGTRSVTLTPSSNGTNVGATLSGTPMTAGTATLSALTCGNTGVGLTKACSGTVAVTATGGTIQLGTPVYSLSGSTTQFATTAASSGACVANQTLASGASCNLLTATHQPSTGGAASLTVTVDPAIGVTGTNTVSGTGVYGTATLSVSGVSCSTTLGLPAVCTGLVHITASVGAVTLNAIPVTKGGSHPNEFTGTVGTCASASLAVGDSCDLGAITFTPGAIGNRSVLLTPTSNGTNVGATLSGTASGPGTATVSAIACGTTGIGNTKACSGTVTITATGGAIQLNTPTYALSGATTQFATTAASSGACSAGQTLASGASCNLLTATHQPSTAGAASLTVTVDPAVGTTGSNTITGTGTYGTAVVNTSAVSCSGSVGVSATCSGNATVTASGGRIILTAAPVFTLSGTNASDFAVGVGVSGACTSGQTLNDGASCNLGPISVTASAGGTRTATLQVTPASGSAGSASLSATASYGTATTSVSGVSCSATLGLSAACTGIVHITASGGAVTLNAIPVIKGGSHPSEFTGTVGTCANVSLAVGNSCDLGALTFTPGAIGTRSVLLTPSSNGTNVGATLSGTGSAAGTATVSAIACGNTGIGTAKACSGTVTVTATGGTIQLGTPVHTLSGATTQFATTAASSGACSAGQTLASGASCNLLTATHQPTAAGAASLTITVDPAVGTTGTNTISGTGTYGTATLSVSGVTCSATVGFTATCGGTATITASNGSLTLTPTAVVESGSHPGDFTIASGACASAALASGNSCNLGAITFTPAASGTRSVTLTPSSNGTNVGATLNGTGLGAGTATVSAINCNSTFVGTTKACTGTLTITATGGVIQLDTPVYALSGATNQFATTAATSGACTAGQTLASGASCNLFTVTHQPTTGGAASVTVTADPAVGTTGSNTVSGTGTYGTATVSVSSVSCSNTVGLSGNCAGTATITASSGAVNLTATPVSTGGSHQADFTVAVGACASASLAVGASCNLGTITFSPSASGTRSVTLTPNSNGTNVAATLNGTGVGAGTATVSSINCGTTGVGLTTACSGTITLTATGGAIQLDTPVYTVSGATSQFATSPASSGACTAGQALASGATCNLLTATHQPSTAGAASLTVTVDPEIGTTGSNTVSGTGAYGTATLSVTGVSCSNTVGLTGNCSGTATITASNGSVTLNAAPLTKSGSHPGEFAAAFGACANATLASGAFCNLGTIGFAPSASGTRSVILTPSSNGTDVAATLNGTGIGAGTASVNSINCGSAGVGTTKACSGTISITATGGTIRLGSTAFSLSGDLNQYDTGSAVPPCTANLVLPSGGSCVIGTVSQFAPTSAGTHTITATVTPAVGGAGTGTVSGTATYGTTVVTPANIACGSVGAGLTQSCNTFTVTAQGGRVQLASSSLTNTNTANFSVLLGGCTGNLVLEAGESCASGVITFKPQSVGALAATINVLTAAGTGTSLGLSGTGLAGEASVNPTSINCATATVGSTAGCSAVTVTAVGGPLTLETPSLALSSAHYAVSAGTCTAGAQLAIGESCTTGAVSFSPQSIGTLTGTLTIQCGAGCDVNVALTGVGYTYAWQQASWGSCTGGSATWELTAWAPSSGCGMTAQSRDAVCNADSNSGTQNRSVTCRRSDGVTVADGLCTGNKPSTAQSCTPTGGFSCGEQPATAQSVLLTDTCTFNWHTSAWSAWSSTCSESATRERDVQCQRSDGEFVADGACAGAKPAATETSPVLTGCSYEWVGSGFSQCTGGSYEWMTGAWGPTLGCGAVTQERTVTCVITANSGSHSQAVHCQRSDAVTVADELCDAESRPAEVAACTPTQNVCGTGPNAMQVVQLNNSCMRDGIVKNCKAPPGQVRYCVVAPL